MLNNLTTLQKMLLALSTLQFLASATSQLTMLFGPTIAQDIVTAATMGGGLFSSWMVVLTGQGAQVKAVAAMPGVDQITVNKQANPTLASLAVDYSESKVVPKAEDASTLMATAKSS